METTLYKEIDFKLLNIIESFKISNIENIIMKMMQEAPKSKSIYYISEYNKSAVMF